MTPPRLVASGGREVELADLVPQLLGRPCSVRVQRIARLWGGYGSVSRITVTNTGSSDVPVQQLIAKQVCVQVTVPFPASHALAKPHALARSTPAPAGRSTLLEVVVPATRESSSPMPWRRLSMHIMQQPPPTGADVSCQRHCSWMLRQLR